MPTADQRKKLIERYGYHCAFCGIPLVRKEVRERFRHRYPALPIWGRRNVDQHAAFQALWLQYDHVIPHAVGGTNDLDNLIVTCAGCNYARMDYTLDEMGLEDPRTRPPRASEWDGLERFR
jgi:5-methylcytosine-specific restriction endonuclease McrA